MNIKTLAVLASFVVFWGGCAAYNNIFLEEGEGQFVEKVEPNSTCGIDEIIWDENKVFTFSKDHKKAYHKNFKEMLDKAGFFSQVNEYSLGDEDYRIVARPGNSIMYFELVDNQTDKVIFFTRNGVISLEKATNKGWFLFECSEDFVRIFGNPRK